MCKRWPGTILSVSRAETAEANGGDWLRLRSFKAHLDGSDRSYECADPFRNPRISIPGLSCNRRLVSALAIPSIVANDIVRAVMHQRPLCDPAGLRVRGAPGSNSRST